MSAIDTDGLTKDFGQNRGIFDLDLRVPRGRVHGFLGPNGAGKTTTIRLLLDLIRPTRGGARLLGHDLRLGSVDIRRRLGFIPGDLQMASFLTGREFLDESASARHGYDAAWRDYLVRLLSAELNVKIRILSKGNKQKIAIIDALQHRPELLILDEPTDGLDPLLRHQVQGLLRQHALDGGTVFMSSHVVHEIQTTCQDVSIVIAGRLQRQTSISDLLAAEPIVVEASVPGAAALAPTLHGVEGVGRVQRRADRVRVEVTGPLLALIQRLIEAGATDLRVREPDLEETFLRLFAEVNGT